MGICDNILKNKKINDDSSYNAQQAPQVPQVYFKIQM